MLYCESYSSIGLFRGRRLLSFFDWFLPHQLNWGRCISGRSWEGSEYQYHCHEPFWSHGTIFRIYCHSQALFGRGLILLKWFSDLGISAAKWCVIALDDANSARDLDGFLLHCGPCRCRLPFRSPDIYVDRWWIAKKLGGPIQVLVHNLVMDFQISDANWVLRNDAAAKCVLSSTRCNTVFESMNMVSTMTLSILTTPKRQFVRMIEHDDRSMRLVRWQMRWVRGERMRLAKTQDRGGCEERGKEIVLSIKKGLDWRGRQTTTRSQKGNRIRGRHPAY